MTDNASPRPWRVAGPRYPIQSPQGDRIKRYVIAVGHEAGPWEAVSCNMEADATLIVRAVNSFDALVEALTYIDGVAPEIRDACADDEHAELVVTIKGLRDIRAALALARGEAA